MIATPGEPDLPVLVPESFHKHTDKELTEDDIKQMDADDQAIQTILLGLPEDIYVVVDSCETAKEIWERVRQMMKGSDIGEQEKKAKLFNEWEKFTSTDGESIESYYHCFTQLINDLKWNKHFPENIASNLKFLNNLQLEWKRHVTIVRQTKNLHEVDFTQIYDFLKMNQGENFMQPPMTSLEDINDPTEVMNATLILFAKAFQLTAPTNNNQRTSSNPRNRQIAQPVINISHDRQIQNVRGNGKNQLGQYAGQVAQNQQGYNSWQNGRIQGAQNAVQNAGVQSGGNQNGLIVVPGIANQNGTGNVVAAKAEGTRNGNQARCYNCRGLGIQLQAEEFDFMADAGDLDETEEVNANCILMANLQHASTSGTQVDKALEEQYTDLLEPITEPQLVPQNDNHVTSVTPKETLELAQESREKMRFLKKEIKLANYAKINHLSGVFVPQTTKSKEELFLSNVSNMVPNEDLSDDTTPSVARKFLNEVKSSLVTLQHVVKQKLTLEIHNWSSSAHKEVHRIISHEIAPIINQIDARVQNFEIQFLQDAAKFVRDFKSLANEADESLDKQKSLELEIERLLKASVSYDIMSIVQIGFVDVPSDLQTELDRTKEKLKLCIIKKEKEYAVLWNNWNLFDSSNRAHAKLHDLIYENAQLRSRVFENTSESIKTTLGTSVTPHVDKPKLSIVTPYSKKLHASILSHSIPQPREFNVVKHRNVIAPGMFKINPSQTPRVDLVPNKQSSVSIRTNPITNSQRHVIVKGNVSSNTVTTSST
nr:hypothetical protein [Tanacetum cinerariifolium]